MAAVICLSCRWWQEQHCASKKKGEQVYDQYGGKKVLRKKKLTSTAITLYTSVSDNVPGNDKRLHCVLAPSAAVVAY